MRYILSLSAVLAASAVASNLSFMNDTPLSRFNAEDKKMAMTALSQVLNDAKDSTPSSWSNPSNGHKGEYFLVREFEKNQLQCRDIHTKGEADELKAEGVYRFCRQPGGKWKISNALRSK